MGAEEICEPLKDRQNVGVCVLGHLGDRVYNWGLQS